MGARGEQKSFEGEKEKKEKGNLRGRNQQCHIYSTISSWLDQQLCRSSYSMRSELKYVVCRAGIGTCGALDKMPDRVYIVSLSKIETCKPCWMACYYI
jgi:hypothetical protein